MLGDLHEVAHEVEELLPGAKRIDQAARHDRRPPSALMFDPPPGDRDWLALLAGIFQDQGVGPLLDEQAGEGPAIVGGDGDGLISLLDRLRRLEDPLDQLDVGHILSECGQVRPEGRGRVGSFVDVTLGASKSRLIEDQGSATGVTQASGIARQRRRVFPAELLVERAGHADRGMIVADDQNRG